MLTSFTGAQSTGKSTLLANMVVSHRFRKCSFVKEVTRKVARQGVTINDNGDNLTQLLIMNEHIYNHILKGCVILDRCVIDGLIYTQWLYGQDKVSKWVLEYAKNVHDMLVGKLDVILYTNPADVPLVDDGERSVNKKFRQDIIDLYDLYFDQYPDVYERTHVLTGTVDERMKQIFNIFKDNE